MATGAVVARIISQYSAVGSKAAKRDIASLGKSFDHFAKRASRAFMIAGAASAAFAVKTGIDSIKAAMDDQKSQVLLANSLRNTTGASDAAIASMESYIGKLQLAVGVSEEKLRPSLALLATATGDLTSAQKLQGIALDISASRGIDLEMVSKALLKAYGGNLGALTKMGVKLSAATLKSKNFFAAQKELAATFKGASAAAAETMTGRLERMKLAYSEIQETLGYALLPVVMKFTKYIVSSVLPKIQQWVDLNKDKLAKSLQTGIDLLVTFTKKAFTFGQWVADHKKMIQEFSVILAAMWTGAKVLAFATALGKIIAAFKLVSAAAKTATIWSALASGGSTLVAGAAALAVFGIGTAWLNSGKLAVTAGAKMTGAGRGGVAQLNAQIQKINAGLKTAQAIADQVANFGHAPAAGLAKIALAQQKILKNTSAGLSTAKKTTAEERALLVVKAALAKFGIVAKTETDPIQLEAARLNLVKQGNLAELAKFAAMKANLELQMAGNVAAQRYADIMAALADNQISSQEVVLLASKWKISSDEVTAYIARIFAANSTPTNDAAILKLLQAWGMTKAEAEKYRDYAKSLSDEKLDPKEIEMLMGKWGMTRAAVLAYAQSVKDGTTFSPSFSTPGLDAMNSWLSALGALNAYNAAVGGKPATGGPGAALGRGGDQGAGRGVPHGAVLDYSPTSNYGNETTSGGSVVRSNGSDIAGGQIVINVAGSILDQQGFESAVQQATQTLARNGSSLSGGSSRGG